jgi:hypothetical protein
MRDRRTDVATHREIIKQETGQRRRELEGFAQNHLWSLILSEVCSQDIKGTAGDSGAFLTLTNAVFWDLCLLLAGLLRCLSKARQAEVY